MQKNKKKSVETLMQNFETFVLSLYFFNYVMQEVSCNIFIWNIESYVNCVCKKGLDKTVLLCHWVTHSCKCIVQNMNSKQHLVFLYLLTVCVHILQTDTEIL